MTARALAVEAIPRSHTRTRAGDTTRAVQTAEARTGTLLRRSPDSCACGGDCPRCRGGHDSRAASSSSIIAIGPTDDSYELDAERAADAIAPAPTMQRAVATPSQLPVAPASVHAALGALGVPLETSVRGDMEEHFGNSFGSVRVHAEGAAAQSAHDVDALAYTVGSHVVFAPGEYSPDSAAGRRLLAHELAHVLQQTAGTTGPVLARKPAPPKGAVAPAKSKTVFHPGVMHNHKPSGRWADVQADPNTSSWKVSQVCKHFDPIDVMRAATFAELQGKWTAIDHLKWFFSGDGADFVEDSNLDSMLRTDSGVQALLNAKIPTGRSHGTFAGHFKITQDDYQDDDFQFAFGAIDRLDFKVDFAAGTLHAWFQDRYEWHPVYPFYSKLAGDSARETNCVHAAAVELKSGTARDYWMKGEATVPLEALQSPAEKHDLQAPPQIY
jgi:hypothetical protein